ncbi:MAG: hypothetical protein M3426_13720 [Actinomycetota bacterium]|nr:hypothetical protein [Actinomycetota bacterium]
MREEAVLEQFALPEDLTDLEESLRESFVVRAKVGLPTAAAFDWDADELGNLRGEVLRSDGFLQATTLVRAALLATRGRSVSSSE